MHTETMVNLLCPCPQHLLKIEQDVVDLVGLPHTSAVTMVNDLKQKKKVDAASAGRDKCSNHGDCPKSKKKKEKKDAVDMSKEFGDEPVDDCSDEESISMYSDGCKVRG